MRREGSAWHGTSTVFAKELSEHVTSIRMRVLELLVVVIAIVVVWFAIRQIREVTAEDPFLFLRLFTRGQYVALDTLLGFLVPLVAVVLGFDLVNSEHNRRTLSRILSQPIYRDALLFGKFFAGLATIAISLVMLWLLVIGLGLLLLGVPPSGEEMARAFILLLVTIAYGGVWLALAMLCSIIFRSVATAALVALGLWLFLTFLWPLLAQIMTTSTIGSATSAGQLLESLGTRQALLRVSPGTLFDEVVSVLLDPSVRSQQQRQLASLGLAMIERGAIPGAPLPLVQSLGIVWGQLVGLVAGTIVLFVAGYVIFQRQEVRA